jgi:hypothetical protein
VTATAVTATPVTGRVWPVRVCLLERLRPVPGQDAGGVRGSAGISAVGPGPVAGLEGHHERQPGLGQFAAEPVLVPVRAVRGHRAEHEPRGRGPDRQVRANLQLGPERRIALPLAKCLAGVYGTACTG